MGEQVLTEAVGTGQPNLQADVACVQGLLNVHAAVTGLPALVVDGVCKDKTEAAIVAYQAAALGMAHPDGVVSPGGPTFTSLEGAAAPVEPAGDVPALLQPQAMPPEVLEEADYEAAAATLGCEVAAIKAVSTVETMGKPFDSEGRPTILFEPHLFSRATGHIYDATEPDISNEVVGSGFGTDADQYPRIVRAAALNFDAALASASWGAFQILGSNFKDAGFGDVESYVTAMRTGVDAHLQAFVSFVAADARKVTALQSKDWAGFASLYNGLGYKQDGYDVALAKAYAANGGDDGAVVAS